MGKHATLPCSRCSKAGEPHIHNEDRSCSVPGCECGKNNKTARMRTTR